MNNLNIIKENSIEKISDIISFSINIELKKGKKVLFFTTGGSSTPMQILVSKKIEKDFSSNLVVMLTDERYGDDNHNDSNWFKLISGGLSVDGIKTIPILCGKNITDTTDNFIKNLETELNDTDYKIGIFGIGVDAHTAGILPNSHAVNSPELACSYDAPPYLRVTITPRTIVQLDEVFVYAMGENKWPVIKSLKDDLPIEGSPAQILKKVPLLTIFTDNKME